MNENTLMQESEVSLFDIVQSVRAGWRNVVGGACLGLLGAGCLVSFLPNKYEAVALVQVGQVNNQQVEAPSFTVERLKLPGLQLAAAGSIKDDEWAARVAASSNGTAGYLFAQVVKATASPAGGLIELKITGASADLARRRAEAAIGEVVKAHDALAAPLISKMRGDLDLAREKLVSAEKEWVGLTRQVSGVAVKDERFTQLSLMNSLRMQKQAETFSLRQSVMAIETSLAPPATQSAKALESVFVSDKPVSPKKGLTLVLGLVGGLLGGIMSIFVLDAWRKARQSRQ